MSLKLALQKPLVFFALISALVPVWISRREMWDGVAIEYAFKTGDLSGLFYAVSASGWPIASWIYKLLLALQQQLFIPYWLGIDMIYTVALLGMAYEVFLLARQRMGLSQKLSVMVLTLFLVHPIWHFLMSGVHLVHMLGFWLLLLGHRLTAQKQLRIAVFGWVFVTLSFQFPASIVMIFWLEWVFLVKTQKTQNASPTRFILVALYAIGWYAASRTVFGPTQTFGGYNQLLLPDSLESIKSILWTGVKFASWLVVLSAPLWFSFVSKRPKDLAIKGSQSWGFTSLADLARSTSGTALIGCLLAVAPYWAVGKGPVVTMPYDWTSRNALPLALPLSIFIALMLEKLAISAQGVHDSKWREKGLLTAVFFWWMGMSILGIGGKIYQIKMEKAIEASLRRISPPPSGIVTLQLPFNPRIRIRQNEANGLLWRAYGRAEWAVLVGPPDSWVELIRETYVGNHPASVKNSNDLSLWSKFYVMGDLKTFNCETTIRLTLPPDEDQRSGWIRWLSWSPLQLNASMEKTSCP